MATPTHTDVGDALPTPGHGSPTLAHVAFSSALRANVPNRLSNPARAHRGAVVARHLPHLPLLRRPAHRGHFSVDHHNPISRGGDLSIGNILAGGLRCNKIEGDLNNHEFLSLTVFHAQVPPEVGKDVFARLYAGGRFMRRR